MAYSSYKLTQNLSSPTPKNQMLYDKSKQVEYLYEFAMDREEGCLLNNIQFNESPRIFNRKTSNQQEIISVETINTNDRFVVGDYLSFDGGIWLCITSYIFHGLYCRGSFMLCNYTIKFQSPTGTILSYPCITSNTKFGNTEGKYITLPSNQKSILLPCDENTLTLDTDRRLYVDKAVKPTPYKIVGDVDTTSYNYGEKGLIEFVVEQDLNSDIKDRPDLGICNYFEPTVTPIPPDPTVPTEIVTITSDATDNQVILGITHTFSATFKNELGQDVSNVIAQYSVDNTYGGKVVLVDNGDGTATVTVGNFDDTYLCNEQFTLKCYDAAHGFESTVLLTIVGMF